MATCSCGGNIKLKVLTKRRKRGQFFYLTYVEHGRCVSCKREYQPSKVEVEREENKHFLYR